MRDETSDSRIPRRRECVLRDLLDAMAERHPDKVFVRFAGGGAWSYAETRARTRRAAAAFQQLGVRQGEHVVSWLPNGPDALLTWFGLNYLGAVYVPINTAYRGNLLAHVLANSDARLLVAHADLAERLHDVDRAALEAIVPVGGAAPAVPGLRACDARLLHENRFELAPPERPIEPWDTHAILYTSGTTGPSKGVLTSYVHAYEMFHPRRLDMYGPDDRYLINLPLFHVGGTALAYSMLARGGSIALVESFRTDAFWTVVDETGSTVVFLLGVMASFLAAAPPAPDDRRHALRTVFMVPLIDDPVAFHERFGVDVYSIYNMTEISTPTLTGPNPKERGSCGRVREGVELRLVDENDCEVPVGAVGEFVVRTDTPWAMNHGYHKMPDATARAWRNGWFHTGDAGRRDAAGNHYFVDRIKDAIRRRGENISSLEVETELCAHPAIREAAVIGVPSEHSEDEVMAVVSLTDGAQLDPGELVAFLRPRMAHFMIPRYVRVVQDVPKTPTAKVRKTVLREEGVTPDTWDREAAGIQIKRERIGG
jgi:crotonobetaine/carnitine-CoA ligase